MNAKAIGDELDIVMYSNALNHRRLGERRGTLEPVTPIPDESWQPIREYVADGLTDIEWEEAIQRYPVGTIVTGSVLAHLPMGYFVCLGDRVVGQVEIVRIKNPDIIVSELDYPPIGSAVRSVVLGHNPGKQIRLSTRPVDLVSHL